MTETPRALLVDSHAHLDFPEFDGRLDKVVESARSAGVTRILTVGTSYAAARRSLDIAARFPGVSAAAAVHPNYVADEFGAFADLRRLFETQPLVAVGETGLDFYRDHATPDAQERAFRAHLDLALERDLPVILHVRDAYERALAVLDSLPAMPRGVFHCFSGTSDFAAEALSRGFFVSFAGQVTFKNADALRASLAAVPLDRLMVETDCPYLAPAPNRGRTNEPAYVRFTAARAAEVLGVPFEALAAATTANARALFGIGG